MRALPALLLAASSGRAEVPIPTYPECGEPDRPDLCPPDFDEDWWLLSYVPEETRDTVRPEEIEMGAGVHADRAWRVTTGRFDVVLALIDSGIAWENDDLRRKVFLNTGELPLPQDASGASYPTYDADGNGLVNIDDYAEDPRVDVDAGRDEADGLLDPSDLIAAFSDGVDDDGNGYVDDIAGWDFFSDDNDAGHDVRDHYGDHGTGVAEEMAAESGNGSDIGVCPNCSILPIRDGDSFLVDGTRVGEAIAYAADMGAAAATLALGSLSSPAFLREAVRYAQERGTVLLAAAGDENSYHHNQPAMLPGVIYLHSVRHDAGDSDGDVHSYLNTWNCNNFGARMDLVASSSACATGSVAVTAGIVGLVRSAARDAGVELSAAEVRSILLATADDVWLSEEDRAETQAYPTGEGWDPFTGYGRVNAERAVQAVVDSDIPPTVELDSPEWFEPVDPAARPVVRVEGAVRAPRSSSVRWTVEVGVGHDPRDWTEVASGEGEADGVLAEIDAASLPVVPPGEADDSEGIVDRLERVNGAAVTVRVRAEDAEGRAIEERRTFFVQPDDDLLPGFPVALGSSAEASPILADLDGDDVFEIVLATSDGRVHAIDGAGEELPGWPVETGTGDGAHPDAPAYGDLPEPPDGIIAAPAVGDLDGDGTPEVVVATAFGAVHAWHADGTAVAGFPARAIGRDPSEMDDDHTWDQGFAAAPTLADLDGDGTLEIVAAGLDGRLYVFAADGSDWGPYPVEICHPDLCGSEGRRIIDSSAVGDLDGDGDLDIVFGTNEAAEGGDASVTHALDGRTAEPLDGWPRTQEGLVNEAVLLPILGEGHPASPALVDLDGDGDLEVFDPIMLGTTDPVHHDGSTALDLDYTAGGYGPETNVDDATAPMLIQFVSHPAVGDLDGDGTPDLVLGGVSTTYLVTLALTRAMDYQQPVGAWSGATGAMLDGWPRQVEDIQFLLAPAIADIDGDGAPEVIYGSAGYLLHAWDADGDEPDGWPKSTGNWIMGSPAVGDLDGDGYLDVVTATREGWLFAWSTRGPADGTVEWMSAFHDPRNTGNHETPLPAQAGPPPAEEPGGCCGGGGGGSALLFVPALLGGARRRRRGGGSRSGARP